MTSTNPLPSNPTADTLPEEKYQSILSQYSSISSENKASLPPMPLPSTPLSELQPPSLPEHAYKSGPNPFKILFFVSFFILLSVLAAIGWFTIQNQAGKAEIPIPKQSINE